MDKIQDFCNWLLKAENRETLGFLAAGVAVVAAAVWKIFTYFSEKKRSREKHSISGISAGRDIIAGGHIFNIQITREQTESLLASQMEKIMAELPTADPAKQELLAKELEVIQEKHANLEGAYEEQKTKLAEAYQALDDLKEKFPSAQLAQAREALAKGETHIANALFRQALSGSFGHAAEAAHSLGLLVESQMDFTAAFQYYKLATQLRPGFHHYLLAAAELAYHLGVYDEAEDFLNKALILHENYKDTDSSEVSEILNNLASIYLAKARYDEAEQLYLRSLNIDEKILGTEHPDIATPLNNLASVYKAKGRYIEAESFYKRSLEIRERILGPEDTLVANSLNNLADLYRIQARYNDAEVLYERSLRIDEKALGPNHPSIAATLNNIGLLYQSQGYYDKAEISFQKALDIVQKTLGQDHPYFAFTLNNMGMLQRNNGNYDKAESLYNRSLIIIEKVFGPNHPDLANTLNNLAEMYRMQNKLSKAGPLFRRALDIYRKIPERAHPDMVAACINNLASLCSSLENYHEAESLYKEAIKILEDTVGSYHPYVAILLINYSKLLIKTGRKAEALSKIAQAKKIRDKHINSENIATKHTSKK